MPGSPDRPPPPRTWLLALLLGVMIFCGRSALVFFVGSPVPFHDQWIAEADQLIVPAAEHRLTWHHFTLPHSDHLLVSTRLIAYGLYRLTGRWDTLAEMLVNNAIIAAAYAALLHAALRRSASRWAALAALVAGFWVATPLFYGNAIWGFQSNIELLVLAAVVQLTATATMQSIDRRWWLASIAAIIGVVSFGSGIFAPALAALICLARARELSRPAFWASLAVNAAVVLLGLGVVARSPTLGAGGALIGNILHTAVHALSWPDMQPSWLALLFWTPTLGATALLWRNRTPAWLISYTLALWTFLQIASIAITRSEPAPALAPRYYDIFAVGIVANAMLLHSCLAAIWTDRARRILALALAVAWAGFVAIRGAQFTRSHLVHDVPALGNYAQSQIALVTGYYGGGGTPALSAAQFPVRPYPEVGYLDRLLAHPAIRAALPTYLVSGPSHPEWTLTHYPWPEGGPKRLEWVRWSASLYGLAFLAYLVAMLSRRSQPTQESA